MHSAIFTTPARRNYEIEHCPESALIHPHAQIASLGSVVVYRRERSFSFFTVDIVVLSREGVRLPFTKKKKFAKLEGGADGLKI